VHTADSGRAGIEQFREHGAEIGVVLLDMQMPGMNGERAFEELKELDAGVRVVLMSGYSESQATHRFLGKGLLAFLQKPYDYDTLLRVVADALESEA
jgi:DNA-binding NtrC family response regulator